ncbi:MAG: toll/interleukin-1 receptor domain-containing protein [Brasilonema angustatum HA4187-MV1]|jgi:hypothetical protein|nr:toll/interleukin-1 receptor domain-containing protein [Brasilonema angustatum HA4187-MV1]
MSSTEAIKVFYCCSDSNKDQDLRQKLDKHLSLLKRQEVITTWDKGMISAGQEWDIEIDRHLNTADIILLLISSDLIYSDYHWGVLVKRAMELHKTRQARVILVLFSTFDNWKSEFGNLKVLPEGEKPVTKWRDHNHAFENIAKGIREEVEQLTGSPFSVQKSLQQIEVGVRLTARTFWNLTSGIVNLATATFSSFPTRARYRRRNRAKLILIAKPIIFIAIASVFLPQLPNLLRIPSLESNPTLNATQQVTPIGWIPIGLVNNTSKGLIYGDDLLQTTDNQIIDNLLVPAPGGVVTIKRKVDLREKKSPSSSLLDQLQPGQKLVIIKPDFLEETSPNSPQRQVWAQVGRCNQTCNQ